MLPHVQYCCHLTAVVRNFVLIFGPLAGKRGGVFIDDKPGNSCK